MSEWVSECRLTPTQKCSVISMRGQVNFLSFSVLWIIFCLFLFFLFCFVLFCLPCFCFVLLFPIVLSALRLLIILFLLISMFFLWDIYIVFNSVTHVFNCLSFDLQLLVILLASSNFSFTFFEIIIFYFCMQICKQVVLYILLLLSETDRSVVFSGSSSFLHQ